MYQVCSTIKQISFFFLETQYIRSDFLVHRLIAKISQMIKHHQLIPLQTSYNMHVFNNALYVLGTNRVPASRSVPACCCRCCECWAAAASAGRHWGPEQRNNSSESSPSTTSALVATNKKKKKNEFRLVGE